MPLQYTFPRAYNSVNCESSCIYTCFLAQTKQLFYDSQKPGWQEVDILNIFSWTHIKLSPLAYKEHMKSLIQPPIQYAGHQFPSQQHPVSCHGNSHRTNVLATLVTLDVHSRAGFIYSFPYHFTVNVFGGICLLETQTENTSLKWMKSIKALKMSQQWDTVEPQ